MIEQVSPQGAALFQKVLEALRQSLGVALAEVFLFAAFSVAISFLINFFIKELPLRRQHTLNPAPLGKNWNGR